MDSLVLYQFTTKASVDPAKTDLELTCNHCDLWVCDVEDGDPLGSLADSAHAHATECTKMPKGLL